MKQRIYTDTSVFGWQFDEEYKKTFDAVKFMRQPTEKLSKKLSQMTKKEILEYFKKNKTQKPIKPCE